MEERRPSRGSDERAPAPATSRPLHATSVPVQPTSVPARPTSASPLRRTAAPAPEAAPYVIVHEEPTVLLACVEDCLISVVHTLTADGVAALSKAMAQLAQKHGTFRSLAITERKTGAEAVDDNRAAVAQLVQQHTRSIRAAAVVSVGTGFRATAVRSMVTAIQMAGRASHPAKIFESLEPAVAWLASMRPELPLDRARVERAVEALRARLRARVDKT